MSSQFFLNFSPTLFYLNAWNRQVNNAPRRDDTEGRHVIYSKTLVKSSCLHYWECASAHRRVAASYPDVSLLMKMCAQRKAGRRQRLYPSHGPLRFITSHSFRARLSHAKNEAPEEEAGRVALHRITGNMQLAEGVIKKLTNVLLLFCFP